MSPFYKGLHHALTSLYGDSFNLSSDNKIFEKVSAAFESVTKWLHRKKEFQPEMLMEKEPQTLINETFNVLKTPLENLSIEQDIPEELTRTLEENVFHFSGFKTYHELKEASLLLKDEKGGFKSFDKFAQDVKRINERYNRNYLNAEYEFAVSSSQMAVKWKDYEKDGDRYNLQYRTAADDRVREEHAALHGITLPPSDKFWDKYYPPNGWRCRCTVVQVRKGKYDESDSDDACKAGEKATTHIGKNGSNKAAIFRFNPGKQEKIFPPKHPYLPKGCGNCEFKLAYDPNNEKCRVCRAVTSCLERTKQLRKETIKSYDNGGKLEVYSNIDRDTDDYKRIESAADYFAKQGKTVVITPKVDSPENCPYYEGIYKNLIGTEYYGKCPDFYVDGVFYEHEGYNSTNPKNAFKNMCNHGFKQSDKVIIEDCGLTDGYMIRSINGQIKSGKVISELWIRTDNGYRRLY